ncbi:hypothetical protein FOL47_004646 [Perkinsus chesapeaki]|uniref:Uncharacterized protein n=1 Tax=Perkinsus chesapeaki TaxID=330153 RepID=A0A7J6KLM2_PERCH|nr:hypothetical protein FOL47_004646 [Perkinsus chesapeaki]
MTADDNVSAISSSESSSSGSGSSASSTGLNEDRGGNPITEESTPEQVLGALSNLPLLNGVNVAEAFKDVDGAMLFQLADIESIKALAPTIQQRSALLVVAKIKAWQKAAGRPRKRRRVGYARSDTQVHPNEKQPEPPVPDNLKPDLSQVLNELMDPEHRLADHTLDEKVAESLAKFKNDFGGISGEMLPPRDVIKELLKAKEADTFPMWN